MRWLQTSRGGSFEGHFSSQQIFQPEHPRACSTDDVECFFSVLRDIVGSNFTLKQVLYCWRRCCIEFSKRIDPKLPFYYFTSSHDRFHEGARPSFSIPSSKTPSAQRFRRREMLTGQAPGRTSLPAAGSKSTKLTFHNSQHSNQHSPSTLQAKSYYWSYIIHTYQHNQTLTCVP